MQDGLVLWDGVGSNNCRVGLTVPQEHADAIRCAHVDATKLVEICFDGTFVRQP